MLFAIAFAMTGIGEFDLLQGGCKEILAGSRKWRGSGDWPAISAWQADIARRAGAGRGRRLPPGAVRGTVGILVPDSSERRT